MKEVITLLGRGGRICKLGNCSACPVPRSCTSCSFAGQGTHSLEPFQAAGPSFSGWNLSPALGTGLPMEEQNVDLLPKMISDASVGSNPFQLLCSPCVGGMVPKTDLHVALPDHGSSNQLTT